MQSKPNARKKPFSASKSAAVILEPTVLNDGTVPGTSRRPNLARHAIACTICHHPQREEIEQAYIDWGSPTKIAREYGLRDRSSIYRHARALNLEGQRRRNVRAALEHIIEQAGDVDVSASAVVAAVQLYAKINGRGLLVERDEQLEFNNLFDRMAPEELYAYAKDGTQPAWFREELAAAGSRVSAEDNDA